ncbi:MAG: hypothetical protein M1816_006003 [Peltula sp. TS41687]|nr:MAG: hypothetical protein M1816_006003 [Peltula sp. TS41687]
MRDVFTVAPFFFTSASSNPSITFRSLEQISLDDFHLDHMESAIKIHCDGAIDKADFRAFVRVGTTEVPNSSVYVGAPAGRNYGTELTARHLRFKAGLVNSFKGLNVCVSYQAYDLAGTAAPLAGGCRTGAKTYFAALDKLSCDGCRK